MTEKTRSFGPFGNVPADAVQLAGFHCKYCKQPVEKFAHGVPHLASRMVFYACRCGAVVAWEDEAEPDNARTWKLNVRLMRKSGANLVIFNGDRVLTADFAGAN